MADVAPNPHRPPSAMHQEQTMTELRCRSPAPTTSSDRSGPRPASPGPTGKRIAFPGPFAGALQRGGEEARALAERLHPGAAAPAGA